MKIFLYFEIIILLFAVPNVYAQDNNINPVIFQKSLKYMNRLKPLQNPRYILSKKVLNGHIADSGNKIIGKLKDMVILHNGDISSILVLFDNPRLSHEVYLNYRTLDIKGTSSGYKLDFDEEDIASIYPDLLADIETAAGQSNIASLSSLLGKKVSDAKGKKFAKLSDILFDEYGNKIMGAYLIVNYKNIRDKGVAIPYSALNIQQNNGYINVTVNQNIADIILEYAKNK